MSEYLDRLKHLSIAKTPVGETANVQTNVSFRKAIDYIERLEKQVEKLETEVTSRGDKICEYRDRIIKLKGYG